VLIGQIVDAIVIFSSFAIDIVFLGGVTGEEGQKAAAVLVVLLLWRIARVVDGLCILLTLSYHGIVHLVQYEKSSKKKAINQ